MSILDIPRDAALPRRLDAISDRDIQDKLRRFERALAAWQNKARTLRRATTALQAASDDLYRVANLDGPDAGSLDPAEAEQRGLLCSAISSLDRHLAPLD
jgi:hypothetical protein